jgi:hypothetical protein
MLPRIESIIKVYAASGAAPDLIQRYELGLAGAAPAYPSLDLDLSQIEQVI